MRRRKFLKSAAAQIPAAMLMAAFIESCKKDNSEDIPLNGKKVIIVGAGISGLSAAKRLREKGFEVVVLEAGAQAGGRIKTTPFGSLLFEEGASWIFGDNGNPLKNLAKDAGANTVIEAFENLSVHDKDGKLYTPAVLSSTISAYNTAVTDVKNAGVLSQTFQTVFNTRNPGKIDDRLWKFLLSTRLEFDAGGDISFLSSLEYEKPEDYNGNDLTVTNGYTRIIDYLAKNIKIEFNKRVTRVAYQNLGVEVNVGADKYEADYVIVTVPLSVLQRNTIVFDPVLPDTKIQAINSLKMGVVNKFILQWSKPFWNNSANFLGITPDQKGKFSYFFNLNKINPNANALVCFSFGQHAIDSEALTDLQVQAEITDHLKAMYGAANVPVPLRFARTKWGASPDIFGAASYVPMGARTSAFTNIARNIANRIFFAGEHTDNKRWGTAHAAYSSGLREANRIVALL